MHARHEGLPVRFISNLINLVLDLIQLLIVSDSVRRVRLGPGVRVLSTQALLEDVAVGSAGIGGQRWLIFLLRRKVTILVQCENILLVTFVLNHIAASRHEGGVCLSQLYRVVHSHCLVSMSDLIQVSSLTVILFKLELVRLKAVLDISLGELILEDTVTVLSHLDILVVTGLDPSLGLCLQNSLLHLLSVNSTPVSVILLAPNRVLRVQSRALTLLGGHFQIEEVFIEVSSAPTP